MTNCIINIYTKYVQNYIKLLSYEIYIYIYIVVGVLTMHDAWDIIVEFPPTCNQLKFNTCKAKFSCMWTNPKTKTWTYNNQAPPHLFLDFLKQIEHSRTSHFPRVHAKIWILTSLLSLFLLRKVLGSSLESSSQVHRFTHPKERQNPTQKSSPYLIFLEGMCRIDIFSYSKS